MYTMHAYLLFFSFMAIKLLTQNKTKSICQKCFGNIYVLKWNRRGCMTIFFLRSVIQNQHIQKHLVSLGDFTKTCKVFFFFYNSIHKYIFLINKVLICTMFLNFISTIIWWNTKVLTFIRKCVCSLNENIICTVLRITVQSTLLCRLHARV